MFAVLRAGCLGGRCGDGCACHGDGGALFCSGSFFRHQLGATEGSIAYDVAQFGRQGVELSLHGCFIFVCRRTISRLRGQVFHADQDVMLTVRPGRRRRSGSSRWRFACCAWPWPAAGLCFQAGCNLQAGSVIHCRVDAVAGGQAGHRSRQRLLGFRDRILCGQGRCIGVKAQHEDAPVKWLRCGAAVFALSLVQDDHYFRDIKFFWEIS